MEKRHPVVFAVVLNWNAAADTIKCVDSLLATANPGLKLVLVDNASTDGSADILINKFPKIHLIVQPFNGGYAAGNNAGIRYALQNGAEYVLVINNDVVVERNFLLPMLAAANADTMIGIVTCKAFFSSDPEKIYCTGGRFSRFRCSGAPMNRSEVNKSSEVSYVSGCILLIRRNVFEASGLLDEKYFMYFEDLEFSRRVADRFKLYYTPDGVVYHKSGGGDSWKNYSEFYLYYNTRNRFWAFRDEKIFYRCYVVLFSLSLALFKSLVILFYEVQGKYGSGSLSRVRAIWKGVKDGLVNEQSSRVVLP